MEPAFITCSHLVIPVGHMYAHMNYKSTIYHMQRNASKSVKNGDEFMSMRNNTHSLSYVLIYLFIVFNTY